MTVLKKNSFEYQGGKKEISAVGTFMKSLKYLIKYPKKVGCISFLVFIKGFLVF